MKLSGPVYRSAWLSTAGQEGLLALLGSEARDLAQIAAAQCIGPSGQEALASWLQVGVALGEIALDGGRYSLSSMVARRMALEDHDAVRCFVPPTGAVALLEIGCGTGTHLRFAASCNPALTALGLELQPHVASMARRNVEAWGLAARVRVEAGDVRERPARATWDLATLHQNIYYFPVDTRVALLRQVRSSLKPGGRLLLLTTRCRGGSALTGLLDLWGAATEGAGRLPLVGELVA